MTRMLNAVRPKGRRRARRDPIRVNLTGPGRHRRTTRSAPIAELLGFYPWDPRSFL